MAVRNVRTEEREVPMKKIKIRPGKAQSAAGFFAGLMFCLIGIFIVIPAAGLFGIFWTAMAGVITVMNGVNAFTDKGAASHEIVIDDTVQNSERGSSAAKDGRQAADGEASVSELKDSIELRLKAAGELYKAGMITEEEYEEKRKEILREL